MSGELVMKSNGLPEEPFWGRGAGGWGQEMGAVEIGGKTEPEKQKMKYSITSAQLLLLL